MLLWQLAEHWARCISHASNPTASLLKSRDQFLAPIGSKAHRREATARRMLLLSGEGGSLCEGRTGGRLGRAARVSSGVQQTPPSSWIAVGTAVADRPPRRSQRARLTHWALASGANVKAHARPWMLDAGGWYPSGIEAVHALPRHAGALASAP
jgi:hypothetical protein